MPAQDIDQLTRLVGDVAKIVSSAYKIKGSIFAALGLIEPLLDLRGINFQEALDEIKDLDENERAALQAEFNRNLDLGDSDLNAKVVQIEGLMERAVELVAAGFDIGNKVVVLVKDAKALLGV